MILAKLDRIAEILWEYSGKPGTKFTGDTLRPRLQAIMTPWMSEGFFADVVVLVEGEGDRAAILGGAASMGHDLERHGCSVIPCMGKSNIDRPFVIFRELGIQTYVVWDGDEGTKDAKPDENRYLLRLMGLQEEDYPSFVADHCACFKKKLEVTLQEEIGTDVFDQLVQDVQREFGLSTKDQAIKNPAVVREIIGLAKKRGKSSVTLEKIVEKILANKKVGK